MQSHSITLDTTGTTYACRRPRYIARGKKKRNTKKEKEKREKKQCCELILICCYCCGDDVGSLAGNSTRASLRVIYPNHWTVEEVIVCIKLPGLYLHSTPPLIGKATSTKILIVANDNRHLTE